MRRHRRRRLILVSAGVQWFVDDRLRHHHLAGQIVRAARTKHEGVHAHADVLALRFDALPHEHTGARVRVAHARFGADFEVGAAAGHRRAYPQQQQQREEYVVRALHRGAAGGSSGLHGWCGEGACAMPTMVVRGCAWSWPRGCCWANFRVFNRLFSLKDRLCKSVMCC